LAARRWRAGVRISAVNRTIGSKREFQATVKVTLLPVDYGIVVVTVRLTPSQAVRRLWASADSLRPQRKWIVIAALGARGFGGVAAGLVLSAATTADVPAARLSRIPSLEPKADPRTARLERFFKNYHCPAPYHTSEYLSTADGYGLDYRLLPAVSIRETSCGRGAKQQNNFWGYHRQSFSSIAVGIDFLAQRLTQHPFYRGKTLQDKLFVYNPRAAYPDEVKRIMRQIE
jgi:hypothetical protein